MQRLALDMNIHTIDSESKLDDDDNNNNNDIHEPNLARVMSPLLTPKSRTTKALSDIFDNKRAKLLAEVAVKEMKIKSAFPEKYQYSGYLSIRMDGDNQWHRKYFVLSNNFLFGGDGQYSTKLSVCLPLEGSTTKLTSQGPTDLTFEIKPYLFRAHSPQICKEWITNIERASKMTIYDIYRFRYELGSSASANSKVIAAKHKISNEEYAIKIINKRKLNDRKTLQREIQILKKLKSPYIVELCDLFETSKYLYIVMEMCQGGELFDQIANMDYLGGNHYTEQDIIDIMQQLASGVQYMHEMGIVHRDLKPENILCVEPNSIKKIKIADFGISAIIDSSGNKKRDGKRPNSRPKKYHDSHHSHHSSNNSSLASLNFIAQNNMMKTRVGTLSYTAPEILKYKPYDERVDYWSLGVIMYILVCGYPPFDGDNDYDLSDEIINEKVQFDQEDWTHVDKETQQLIDKLLHKNPRRRANCQDIIEHSWKIDVKHSSFKKAHNKFKQTVFKRKIRSKTRANTATTTDTNIYFDKTPTTPFTPKELKDRMQNLLDLKINALDDSVIKRKYNTSISLVQFDAQQKESQIESWQVGRGRKKSKTTEYLYLEAMSPINPRDSIFFSDNINVMDDLPEFPQFDLVSYSNRSSMNLSMNVAFSPSNNRENRGISTISEISEPESDLSSSSPKGYYHSPANSGSFHSYSYSRNRLSCLSSRSFLESFTNKRKSVGNYRRSSKHNKDNNSGYSTNTRSTRTKSSRSKGRKSSNRSSNRSLMIQDASSNRSQKYGNTLNINIDTKLDKMLNNNNFNNINRHKNDSWCTLEEKMDVLPKPQTAKRKRKVTFPDENEKPDVTPIKLYQQKTDDTFVEYDDEDDNDDNDDDEKDGIIYNRKLSNWSQQSLTQRPDLPYWNVSNVTQLSQPQNDNGIDIMMLSSLAVQSDDESVNNNSAAEYTFIKHDTSNSKSTNNTPSYDGNNSLGIIPNKSTKHHKFQISIENYDFVNDDDNNFQISSL